jgi:hypothetical protein
MLPSSIYRYFGVKTNGRANDFNIRGLDFTLTVLLMVLSLLVYVSGLGGVRVVRLDRRWLDQRGLGRRMEI